MKHLIALVDDDRNILISLEELLKKEEFEIHTYNDGQSALIGMSRYPPELAVIDIKTVSYTHLTLPTIRMV